LDEETDLYYAGARYLDPVIGRWLGVDALSDKNLFDSPYSYVINNPLRYIDPLGLDTTVAVDRETGLPSGSLPELVVEGDRCQGVGCGSGVYGGTLYFDPNTREGQQALKEYLRGNPDATHHILGSDRYGLVTQQIAFNMAIANGQASILNWAMNHPAMALATAPIGGVGLGAIKGVGLARSGAGLLRGTLATSSGVLRIGGHTVDRMASRGISRKMIKVAIEKGQVFYDPKNKALSYVLRGGFASGKDLLVGVNPGNQMITTVIRGKKMIKKRFIPLN